ncbi:P-loop containing nucleoside triphosphate hydrolase protein, partial [Rhodotorula sp. JG-1b]
RMLIAAIGGATGSGKTTLAKHLGRIIPSLLVFQDDFAPPEDKVPIDPRYGWQDWDDKAGAIEWDRQREVFHSIRESGQVPPEHSSHDHLNEQVPVEIEDETERKWAERRVHADPRLSTRSKIVVTEGFLILVDPETSRQFDLQFFLRGDYATLKQRRIDRQGYVRVPSRLIFSWLSQDPPGYWEKCVWPAYLSAHAPLFVDGDVEKGAIDPQQA